ncbi:hypothetical protein [Emticicia agri]|uniref:Lipoprotein n=1 Tax=Emticicia agri TaxID=2492393 RepID=A0A4Q5LTU0_9BACT|nr:hypothetical protein [Emticicia agri]RYU92982.1 hypothetical protein EWM59_24400 [Emticicia agri]
MKNCFLVLLGAICLFSCAKPAITINLDDFDRSYEAAFASQFQEKNGKIYSINAASAFEGTITYIEYSTQLKEMTLKDGKIIAMTMHDNTQKLLSEGKREGDNFRIMLYPKANDSTFKEGEYLLTHFSDKDFMTKELSEQEGVLTMKGYKGKESKVNVSINRQKDLLIAETIEKKYGAVTAKTISFTKTLPDSTEIELTCKEDTEIQPYQPYHNRYVESMHIFKEKKGGMKLEMQLADDGNLRIYSEMMEFGDMHCSVSEVLVAGATPLTIGESDCVSTGLKMMNLTLKKQITRTALKNRIMEKQKNNRLVSRDNGDIDFYF